MTTSTPRVGFAGLGTMGAFMATNLAAAGFVTTVWNRTPGKEASAVAAGARYEPRLAALAENDVIVLCVTDAPQVQEILDVLSPNLRAGTVVLDCSTTSPLRAQEFATALAAQGVGFVDAPVSGGSEGARLGTLSIMVGGDDDHVATVTPMLQAMGKTITHLGPVGAGQWAKAINQVVLAGTYLAVAEGVTLGLKAGLDVAKVVDAISGGAASSWVLQQRSGRMIDNDYPLGFKIALHRKDLGIALSLAEAVEAPLAVTQLAAAYEDQLIADDHGDDDNSALARIVRAAAGLPH